MKTRYYGSSQLTQNILRFPIGFCMASPLQELPKKQARSLSTSSIILYCQEIHQLKCVKNTITP